VPPPPMSVAETLAMPGVLVWAIMLVGVLAALGLAAVHIVPIHERLVVIRLGRCHRVRGPGPVLIVPGLERAVAMSVVPARTNQVAVDAVTRDGVAVTAAVSLWYRVADPARAVAVTRDALGDAGEATERAVRHRLAQVGMPELLCGPHQWAAGLVDEVDQVSRSWGVRVLDLEIVDVALRLTPELRRWMR
jgi:regulator of protease activity HflC (stomatin/prohibitin superfamily)